MRIYVNEESLGFGLLIGCLGLWEILMSIFTCYTTNNQSIIIKMIISTDIHVFHMMNLNDLGDLVLSEMCLMRGVPWN